MKVTVILIVIGDLDTVIKGLEKEMKYLEIKRRVETIQTTALLRTIYIVSGMVPKIWKKLEELEITKNRHHPDPSIVKIGQNTEKSPGDLGRLAVTQTPVRNYPSPLVWKTLIMINCRGNNRGCWELKKCMVIGIIFDLPFLLFLLVLLNIFFFCEFFTPALADGLSLEYE